jgi:GntR family transcriptional repressor for pyruvate dehydrogenase complex
MASLEPGVKLAQRLARQIAAEISEHELRPGDRLDSEASMVARYGVGRPSLREALRILEDQGLLVLKTGPGGGPVVSALGTREFGRIASLYFQMSGTTLRELGEALAVIEPVMARQAAERATEAGVKALVDHLDPVWDQDGDTLAVIEQTSQFHRIVARMSGNGVLSLVAIATRELYEDRVAANIALVQGPGFGESTHNTFQVHEAIAAAIRAGRGRRAETLMRDHVLDFTANAEQRFPEFLDRVITWQ